MSTLENRAGTALIGIDVQNDVVANTFRARAQGTAVIWVQHSDDELEYGGDGWQIVAELTPLAGERLVARGRRCADRWVCAQHRARGVHPGVKRDTRRRRAHCRRPVAVRCAAA